MLEQEGAVAVRQGFLLRTADFGSVATASGRPTTRSVPLVLRYYDSGYIQPLDFFGDGTRIPLIIVSPFAQGGHVSHSYSDHVSLVKFIERNWKGFDGLRKEVGELGRCKVKSLSLNDRFVIALHSPSGVIETGLPLCPPEKKARKLAREVQWDTFSGPVSGRKVQNCRDFQRLSKELS
jgi:hypothetical protein